MENSIPVTPSLSVLSSEAITRIHNASLKILSETGIRVDSKKALKVLEAAPGVKLHEERRVIFQPEIVEWAIEQTPQFVDIFKRTGELAFQLGSGSTRFGIGVTNLFFQEPASDKIVPFTRQHMRDSVGLGNQLASYDVISTIGIIRDVEPISSDLVACLEMAAGTEMPLILLISDEKQFVPCLHLLQQLMGDLAMKPFAIPYFNPVTPLILNHSTASNMISAIKRGMPIIFSNYGMAGISTPITTAGTLALLNAELLAGLVFSQLVKPGTPVILGSLPAFFDMKTMVDFFDPQTMLLNLACAEMMAFYHIPHAGTSGSANGYGADLIASEALWLNQLTSCLGKVGLAPFIGGSFGSKVFSPKLVVYANEIIEQARQFKKGFHINEETLALNEVSKIGIGGNYVSSPQTMKLFRKAYHNSTIFPRLSLEKWQETNQPEAVKVLSGRTMDLLTRPKFAADQQELIKKGEYLIAHPEMLARA